MSTTERNELVSENLGLVHACCRRFVGRGVEYDDLYQAGCLGLIRAASGFEAERGLMFSTYAFPAILGEIRRLFREGGGVKVSRSLKELALRCATEQERLTKKTGEAPTVSQLAAAVGESAERVSEALCAAQPTLSLTVWEDDDYAQQDLPTADDTVRLCENMALHQAMNGLCSVDRQMIELRYFREMTQTETAKILKMSQVQVSRREKKVIGIIRERLK